MRFCKITIRVVVSLESVEVFRKDPFLALYFSRFSSIIFLLLCLLPSAVFFRLTTWTFGPPSLLEPCCDGGYTRNSDLTGSLVEYRQCLSLNPKRCEAFYFSVDRHQANPQPHVLFFNSSLRFNPTPTILGITFDRTLSFFNLSASLIIM